MQQSISLEANSLSASQKIPRFLWKPKVRYRIHNSAPTVSVLTRINPADATLFHRISYPI
jgi:hypothetical protein